MYVVFYDDKVVVFSAWFLSSKPGVSIPRAGPALACYSSTVEPGLAVLMFYQQKEIELIHIELMSMIQHYQVFND